MSAATSAGRRLRHGVEYAAVATVAACLRPLPMHVVRRCGEALGRAAYRVAASRRRIALENVERALPHLPPAERGRIVRGAFEHFGRMLLEVIRFGTLRPEEMLALADVEGEEHVRRAYEAGKGLILVGGHFGYWEMQGITHALSWRPISVMARPLDNPRLHDMLEAIRTRTGNSVIYRQGSIRKVLRALNANTAVAILIDQHLHTSEAVYVDFFGRPAATTSIVASLAFRTGATVIHGLGLPLPGGRYRFIYETPVPPPPDESSESIRDFTQRCSDVLERYIRRYPELWLWMHRRWREAPGAAPHAATAEPLLDGERHA